LGSESFVVGSYDFYIGYVIDNGLMICLDLGHFHPTESIADKLSSILQYIPELLIHVSRGVRWDSDHIPIYDDQLTSVCSEIVRCKATERVHLSLDYFDASINRMGAWVIGARATQKALLFALLEPFERLKEYEESGDYFQRLAVLEELKGMPYGAIWDYYCLKMGVSIGDSWIKEIQEYEREILSKRI